MRISLTRAIAGTAIAAAAVLTAVGTASASTTPPAPTTLSIAAAKSTIIAGQRDLISGALLSGTTALHGKVVWLARVTPTATVLVDAHFTGKRGGVYFNVYPKATVTYELVFRGTPKYAPTTSIPVTVTVLPAKLATTLSIVESRNVIKPGQTDTISGTLATRKHGHPLAGQLVWLFRLVHGKLTDGNGHLTGKFGRVFFTVSPAHTARYILVFFGSSKLSGTYSGVVTVIVS